jgi:hypothetical protein
VIDLGSITARFAIFAAIPATIFGSKTTLATASLSGGPNATSSS